MSRNLHDPARDRALTDRQREVMGLMARGLTNGQIAEQLGISLDGAKFHVGEILSRLGATNREEAVEIWKREAGLLGRLHRVFLALSLWKAAGIGVAVLLGGASVVLAVLLINGRDEPGIATGLAGFHHPRTVHLAPPPDGRVIVTDLGTGRDDGRVVAVDLDSGRQTVLLDHLPSTTNSGQRYADLAGPSGAAMARDGTVCAVIGDANKPNRGFNTLRCSNGLTADFKAFEAANNPDGREIASNPYDIVWDGQTGWYVSDAAANAVLHVDEHGTIEVAALFASFCCLANQGADPVPTGLSISISGRGDRSVGVALLGGAVGMVGLTANEPRLLFASLPNAIAVADSGKDSFFLTYEDAAGTPNSGAIIAQSFRQVATGLDHPTGMARLQDGRFVVAEEARARVSIVNPLK